MPGIKLPFEKPMQADDLQRLLTLKMPTVNMKADILPICRGIIWAGLRVKAFPKER
jgi:hypothetical protein